MHFGECGQTYCGWTPRYKWQQSRVRLIVEDSSQRCDGRTQSRTPHRWLASSVVTVHFPVLCCIAATRCPRYLTFSNFNCMCPRPLSALRLFQQLLSAAGLSSMVFMSASTRRANVVSSSGVTGDSMWRGCATSAPDLRFLLRFVTQSASTAVWLSSSSCGSFMLDEKRQRKIEFRKKIKKSIILWLICFVFFLNLNSESAQFLRRVGAIFCAESVQTSPKCLNFNVLFCCCSKCSNYISQSLGCKTET